MQEPATSRHSRPVSWLLRWFFGYRASVSNWGSAVFFLAHCQPIRVRNHPHPLISKSVDNHLKTSLWKTFHY